MRVEIGDQVPPPYPIVDIHVPERNEALRYQILLGSMSVAVQRKLVPWIRSGQQKTACSWQIIWQQRKLT